MANQSVIENAVKTRAAQAFFMFEELPSTSGTSLFDLVENSKNGWALTRVANPTDKRTTLNTSSKYHTDFAGLDPYASSVTLLYDGVPVDNALYLPSTVQSIPSPPISPGQTVMASTIFVPQTESYLDGSNVPQTLARLPRRR